MQDQLSLFPSTEPGDGRHWWPPDWAANEELAAIDEVLVLGRRWRSGDEFRQLMAGLTRHARYSLLNALLLHLQNPQASQVATAARWRRCYRRRPRPGARPLVILAPMAPVLFLYDIRDTEGPPVPPEDGPAAALSPAELASNTRANCALHGIHVARAAEAGAPGPATVRLTAATRRRHPGLDLDPRCRYLLLTGDRSLPEQGYLELVHGLAQIFCGHFGIDADAWWPERSSLSPDTEELEAATVRHLVARRRGIGPDAPDFWTHLLQPDGSLPPYSLHAVLQAAAYIEQMGRQRWTAARRRSRYRGRRR